MSEECNFNLYHQDLEHTLAANIPCIPFLGIFLTVVVQHDSYTQMSSKNMSSKNMRRQSTLLETYTILDAITVRNRLEKLRWWSSIDFHSPPESPVVLENDGSSETILSGAVQNGVLNDSISSLHSIPESKVQHENASSGNGLIPPYSTTKPAKPPVLKQLGKTQAVNLDTQADNMSSPAVASVSNNPLNSSLSENKAKVELMSRSLECLMEACLDESSPTDAQMCSTLSSSLTNLGSSCDDGIDFLQDSATPDLPTWVTSDYCADPTHSLPLMSQPPKPYLRKRRTTPDVWRLHVCQADYSSSPLDLLDRYQFLSLGHYVQLSSKPEIRAMLDCPHNTEGQNYKLSYEREPQS